MFIVCGTDLKDTNFHFRLTLLNHAKSSGYPFKRSQLRAKVRWKTLSDPNYSWGVFFIL